MEDFAVLELPAQLAELSRWANTLVLEKLPGRFSDHLTERFEALVAAKERAIFERKTQRKRQSKILATTRPEVAAARKIERNKQKRVKAQDKKKQKIVRLKKRN